MINTVKRKELLNAIIHGGKQVNMVKIQEVVMDVGIDAPLHLHPCPTMGIVLEGEIIYQGENEEGKILRIGDAFYEPANAHILKFNNCGSIPAKFAVFYLLEKCDDKTIEIIE